MVGSLKSDWKERYMKGSEPKRTRWDDIRAREDRKTVHSRGDGVAETFCLF